MNRMFQGRWLILPLLAVLSFTACKKELRLADYEGPATDAYTFVAKNISVEFVDEDELSVLVMRRGGDDLSAVQLSVGVKYKGNANVKKEFDEVFSCDVVEFAEGSRDGYLKLNIDHSKLESLMADFTFQAAVDLPTDKFAITAITSIDIVPRFSPKLEWEEHPTIKEVEFSDAEFVEPKKSKVHYCKNGEYHYWKIEKFWDETDFVFCIHPAKGKAFMFGTYELVMQNANYGSIGLAGIEVTELRSTDGTPDLALKFIYAFLDYGAEIPIPGDIKPVP